MLEQAQGAFSFFDRIQWLWLFLDDLQSANLAFLSSSQDFDIKNAAMIGTRDPHMRQELYIFPRSLCLCLTAGAQIPLNIRKLLSGKYPAILC